MTPDQRILYERCYRAALAYRRAPTPEKRGAWEKARLAYAGDPAERASVTAERAPDFEAAVQVVMVLEELDADAARQAVEAPRGQPFRGQVGRHGRNLRDVAYV